MKFADYVVIKFENATSVVIGGDVLLATILIPVYGKQWIY